MKQRSVYLKVNDEQCFGGEKVNYFVSEITISSFIMFNIFKQVTDSFSSSLLFFFVCLVFNQEYLSEWSQLKRMSKVFLCYN